MSGKGKPFRRAKKVAGKPQEPPRAAAGQSAAQPATTLAEDIDTGQKTLTILPTAPVKPTEEAEAVYEVLAVATPDGYFVPDSAFYDRALHVFAAALVRRFPGLTRKPGVPRADREDAMQAKRGRLPDGSIFLAVWRAADADGDGQWEGFLVTEKRTGLAGMLSDMIAAGSHFRLQAAGVFGLMKGLDRVYRTWLGRQKGGGK